MINERAKLKGTMEVTLRDSLTGKVKLHEIHDNMIMLIGFTNIRDRMLGTGGSGLTYLGIGYGTGGGAIPAADTQINFQGTPITDQNRKLAVSGTPSQKILTLTTLWVAGDPNPVNPITIYELGVFWAAGTGNNQMFSRVVKTSGIIKAITDDLELTYTLTMSEI